MHKFIYIYISSQTGIQILENTKVHKHRMKKIQEADRNQTSGTC